MSEIQETKEKFLEVSEIMENDKEQIGFCLRISTNPMVSFGITI